jgi:hypothetical protein
MNDASPRFAEGQTGAASLLSSEEGNRLAGVDEAKEIFGLQLSQTAALQRVEA